MVSIKLVSIFNSNLSQSTTHISLNKNYSTLQHIVFTQLMSLLIQILGKIWDNQYFCKHVQLITEMNQI